MKINKLFKGFLALSIILAISIPAKAQQPNPLAEKYEQFKLINNTKDQEKFYIDLIKQHPLNKANKKFYVRMRSELAVNYLTDENINKYREYSKYIDDALSLYELNNVVEKWVDERKHIEWVDEISKQFLSELESGAIKDEFNRAHEIFLEVSATVDCIKGNNQSALTKIQEALKDTTMRNMNYFKNSKPNFINRYGFILAASGQTQKAIDTLSAAVLSAESTPILVTTLKNVYAKAHGLDSADRYVASLQNDAYQHYYKELENKWIVDGKPAPDVAITKLNGQGFKASDYKGKILIIDFWSTTCTPCKACFPAFERIVEEYKNQPFQLFVAGIAEDSATQQAYVDKTKLTLDVLRDPDMALFNAIGSKGTPEQFIVDPDGIIRMHGIGYAGSTDREYYEMKAMIEITKKHALLSSNAVIKN